MTKKDLFENNLVLTTEFNRYVLEHPEIAERIPNNSVIVILPEYDEALAEENLKIAETRKEKDQPLLLVKVKKLAPERKSRLIKSKLELGPA